MDGLYIDKETKKCAWEEHVTKQWFSPLLPSLMEIGNPQGNVIHVADLNIWGWWVKGKKLFDTGMVPVVQSSAFCIFGSRQTGHLFRTFQWWCTDVVGWCIRQWNGSRSHDGVAYTWHLLFIHVAPFCYPCHHLTYLSTLISCLISCRSTSLNWVNRNSPIATGSPLYMPTNVILSMVVHTHTHTHTQWNVPFLSFPSPFFTCITILEATAP